MQRCISGSSARFFKFHAGNVKAEAAGRPVAKLSVEIPPGLFVVFDSSNVTKYSGSAGAITLTANRERQIQFALRLEF